MTDDALKRAYRQLTASQSAAGRLTGDGLAPAGTAHAATPIAADTLAAVVNGDSAEAGRDAHLAAVAESAQNADLLRVLRSLSNDASSLSADVQELNGQTRTRFLPTRRPALRPARWYALAASVAMAGVVGLVMKAPVGLEPMPSDHGSAVAAGAALLLESGAVDGGKIMMASFEENPESASAGSQKPSIFVGDFDS